MIAYWARLTALQSGMKVDKSSKEALADLLPLMDWLEAEKGKQKENEAVTNDVRKHNMHQFGKSSKSFPFVSEAKLLMNTLSHRTSVNVLVEHKFLKNH